MLTLSMLTAPLVHVHPEADHHHGNAFFVENRVRYESDQELKLVGLQPTKEQRTEEASGAPPEAEHEKPAARPVNWRVWGVAAALVLLVSGGGLFAWRSGAIPGITQPVRSEVSGDQAPRLVPMIEDRTGCVMPGIAPERHANRPPTANKKTADGGGFWSTS